jgi:hypothetical protein
VEEESQALWIRKQLAYHLMKMRHWHVTQASGSEVRGLDVPRNLTRLIDVGKLLAILSHLLAPHPTLNGLATIVDWRASVHREAPANAFLPVDYFTHPFKRKKSHVGPFSDLDLTEPSAASASPTH